MLPFRPSTRLPFVLLPVLPAASVCWYSLSFSLIFSRLSLQPGNMFVNKLTSIHPRVLDFDNCPQERQYVYKLIL
ncbi:hypothetical protein C8R48DRAFT_721152 [Suillus tomentosus]|nr:hypothetical protein C8R48DRAFT_721152 [Suillus tomentosus]